MTAVGKPHDLNDSTLMWQISAQNDDCAFEQLFHMYYGRLCRYAFRLTRAPHTAEEVVSEVFLKCWKNRESLQIQSSVYAYLARATHNLAIDHLRSMVRQRGRLDELKGDFRGDYASPSDVMIGDETNAIIESAIEALSPQCRLIFRMSRDNGMSYAEIAHTLNLSIKTVEVHMGRSLKVLRASLRRKEVISGKI